MATPTKNFTPVSIQDASNLNVLCSVINDWATKKGWNDGPDSIEHRSSQIALMHSELSECLEFIRTKPSLECPDCGREGNGEHFCLWCGSPIREVPAFDDHVPSLSGESAELADVLIRIFHYCGEHGIDLGNAVRLKHEYNITRPYRHGKVI